MDNPYDFKSLTNEEEEKIIKRSLYIPGMILLTLIPLLSHMVLQGEGFNPLFWAIMIASGPAIFVLSVIMIGDIWQQKPLEFKKIYKTPAIVFYLIFIVVAYQTVFSIDHEKKNKQENQKHEQSHK